ncbi:MAG: hypothetical protein AAFZ63_26330 [Bacteroidota bacterium]
MSLLKRTLLVSLHALLICGASPLFSQIIGGTSTGQMAPKETQAGSVVSGGVSGDVNMFTGTFNAAYDLGSVTTLSGLSFSLSMSYNSTFASGDNVPLR